MNGRLVLFGLLAVDALAFVGFGVLTTIGLAGMLPYGHPIHSAEVVLTRYALHFVLLPALILLVLGKFALSLHERGKEVAAYLVLVAPWALWPWFFLRALA